MKTNRCLHINTLRLRASVLECGGWRGTGLTPLFSCDPSTRIEPANRKAVCALTPHPPQSKTLARQIKLFGGFGRRPCMRSVWPSRLNAFTLIELLVVIAIIAILASML
ncbi:MAG: type II secretion system protein, partial [Verrucomicrobiota bacterium]